MVFNKRHFLFYVAIVAVVVALLTPEVEARRRILKGRRTVNRTYFRDPLLPPWAIVLLVGVGEIIIGGVIFFIMKKMIVDPPLTGSYTPANTIEVENA